MTLSVRRLFVSTLALGTLALTACNGDPLSPKATTTKGPNLEQVYNGSTRAACPLAGCTTAP